MIRVGFLKEVFRGSPHIVALEKDGFIHIKTLSEFGKQIVDDGFEFVNEIPTGIPDGFIFTGFAATTSSYDGLIKTAFGEMETKQLHVIHDATKQRPFSSRTRFNASRMQSKQIALKPISKTYSTSEKLSAISFKARAFDKSLKRTKLSQNIKAGIVAIDELRCSLKAIPTSQFSHQIVQLVNTKYGHGFIRKTVLLSKKTMDNNSSSSRRTLRRAESLSESRAESFMNHRFVRMNIASMRK